MTKDGLTFHETELRTLSKLGFCSIESDQSKPSHADDLLPNQARVESSLMDARLKSKDNEPDFALPQFACPWIVIFKPAGWQN